MFTVEIKINGTLIKLIKGQNIDSLYCKTLNVDDFDTYEYVYTSFDIDKEQIESGNVIHKRKDGIFVLVKKILEDLKNDENNSKT